MSEPAPRSGRTQPGRWLDYKPEEGQTSQEKNKRIYRENKDVYIENTYKRRAERMRLITEYKLEHPCVRCGETHPGCLDFHHKDPALKDFTIGRAISNNYSLPRIRFEMEKCIVLCANCHRIEHWNNTYNFEFE